MTRKNRWPLLLAFLALASRADEVMLASVEAGDCRLTASAEARWHVLIVRHQPPVADACQASLDSLSRLLAEALSAPPPATPYTAISLGRLVAYPALSQGLARAARDDPRWNRRRGRAQDGGDNRLVGLLLTELMTPLADTLARQGYRFIGVSVEKVLVAPAATLLPPSEARARGKLPYDAQLWLRIEPQVKPPQPMQSPAAPAPLDTP